MAILLTCLLLASLLNVVCAPVFAKSTEDSRPRVGLALGGGGTRGYAHTGVLRVLHKYGIPIDVVAGTSMGSVVGGLYCTGHSPDTIENILLSRELGEAFELSVDKLDLVVLPIAVVPRTFVRKSYSGLYKGNKFSDFIDSKLPHNMQNIEQMPITFGAVVFNLLDAKSYAIRKGDIGRAMQASSAVPELRQPVPWQGMLLVDGGVTDNLPVRHTKEMGANVVIAVNVDERLYPLSDSEFRAIGSVSNRCVTANLDKLDNRAEKEADVVIHPEVSHIKLLSRQKLDMERAILEGERAAMEAPPKILEKLKQYQEHDGAPAK